MGVRCFMHGSQHMTRLRAIELALGTLSRSLSVVSREAQSRP